jgi:lipopolysaccharide transport system permease protein
VHKILRPRHGLAQLRLDEVWAYRELVFFLAWRDILVRYKQTTLGVLWALLRPFLTMVVFTFVFGRLAHVPTGTIPYPVFAFAALLPWQLFSTAFSESSASVVSNSALVSKVYFPRLIIPLSAVVSAVVDFLVSSLMFAALLVWFHVAVSSRLLWVVPLVLLCLVTALGAGVWFAALFVRYRDVRHLIPFVVQMGLYVSPVGFSSDLVPPGWRFIYSLNPMVGVIDGFRWALLGGSHPLYWPGIQVSVAVAFGLLVSGLYYFRNTERSFADII